MTMIAAEYVNLASHWHSLSKNKWFILCVSLLMSSLCMIYAMHKPKQYQASVLLHIHPSQRSSLGSITNSNQTTYKDNISEEPISVLIALIRSRFILEPAIQSLNLDVKITPYAPHFFSKKYHSHHPFDLSQFNVPLNDLNKKLYLVIESSNHYKLYAANHQLLLAGNTRELVTNDAGFSINIESITASPHSEFILIKRPRWEVMNEILLRLHIIDLAGETDASTHSADILQLTLTGHNPQNTLRLINKIALIAQVKDRERKIAEAKKTLTFLYEQLPIVQDSLKKSEMKWNQYRFTNNNMDPKLQAHYLFTHLSDIDKQLEIIRIKKIALMQQLTDRHPDIIALNETDYALQKQRNDILTQIKMTTQADQIDMNLAREVEVNKNLYMQLLDKIHSEQVITAGIVSDIGILSLATSPETATRLKPSLLGLAGFLMGLLLSSLGILVWEMFKKPKLECLDFTRNTNYDAREAERA